MKNFYMPKKSYIKSRTKKEEKMIKKFEIKSHDGPGRIGKIDGELSPRLFSRNELKIAPSEGSAYNVDREIAEFNVKETLRLAMENVDECDIAVIQGSKYIDLRVKWLKELEDIGYNGLIIANGDALLTNSKDLVETIVTLKKEAKKNSYFIFSFTEVSFMPILVYMGIDGFLTDSANYYSYLNVLQTPTKAYDLNTYPIYEEISQKEMEGYACAYTVTTLYENGVVSGFTHTAEDRNMDYWYVEKLTADGETLYIREKIDDSIIVTFPDVGAYSVSGSGYEFFSADGHMFAKARFENGTLNIYEIAEGVSTQEAVDTANAIVAKAREHSL